MGVDGRRDWIVAATLSGLAGVGIFTWRQMVHLWGALGTDAALWGLTAMDLRADAAPLVPPAYPALIGLVARAGPGLVPAGEVVAGTAAALLPGAVWLASRAGGAARGPALLAALLTALCPDLAAWAQQVQPDSLISLGAVCLAGLLARAQGEDRGAARSGIAAAVLGGLLPLVREHGLPLAGITALVLGCTPGRRGAAVLTLAVVWVGPLAVGRLPALWPGDEPWSARAGGALAALRAHGPDDVPFARTLQGTQRGTYYDLIARHDLLGILRFHATRSFTMAWDGWALIGGALVFALISRRRAALALALPVLAALPAAIVWSQRRHVLVLVPLALAGWAAAAPTSTRLRWIRTVTAIALAAAIAGPWTGALARLPSEQQTEIPRARAFADVAAWLDAHAPPGSLLGGVFQDVGLYHPLPRHDPDGTEADWKTFLVADREPTDRAWRRVYSAAGGMNIYQLAPETAPRPCASARPRPDTAFLAVARAHATLIGADAACVPPAEGAPPG